MEISKSDRDAYLNLLYDMYDADLVDVAQRLLARMSCLTAFPLYQKTIILTKIAK